jgi:hypothetical protein
MARRIILASVTGALEHGLKGFVAVLRSGDAARVISMADYYPLIAQAVESLEESTEMTRRAIYDLARSAMLAKLRSLTPELSESDIFREEVALDDAIRRAEAEAVQRRRNRPSHSSGGRAESPPRPMRHVVGRNGPRPTRKLAALTIMTLLMLVVAGLKGPGMIASLRGASDGIAESIAGGDRDALSKMIDLISSKPFGLNPSAAQKVVLYEEDQGDPAGNQYGGTVVWRTDSVSPGPGLAPQVAIRAEIEIPERQMSLRWSLRSNDDPALPASHTVELMFELPADFPHGGISSIPGLLMKEAESARGVSLTGLSVKAAPNSFLLTLSTAEVDVDRNIQLLKERSWIDIPVAFDDGRRAIIAVEKGPSGERAFSEAFAAWEQ